MTLPGQNHNVTQKSERYTPPWIVALARDTMMGDIDLDPCSCEKAQEVVKARQWVGLPNDGLATDWGVEKRVFVNPPGGRGSMVSWLTKCLEYYGGCVYNPFFFVGFNLQQLPDALRLIDSTEEPHSLYVAVTFGTRPSYWVNHPDERGHPYGHSFFVSTLPILSERTVRIR